LIGWLAAVAPLPATPNKEAQLMEEHEHTPKQPAERRRKAERLLQETAERLMGSPRRSDSDRVRISFDWKAPALSEPKVITFFLRVGRHGRESSIRFRLDSGKLTTAEQQKLADFLARRHAAIATHYDMAWHLSWLLDLSLQQAKPHLTTTERQHKVRQLLLAEHRSKKQNVPTALGVSPLLLCVSQRARNRLLRMHSIDIADLEGESIQLSRDLAQFKRSPLDSGAELRSKADRLTRLLIAHHQKVKHAGMLLGGQAGSALDAYADSAIEWLLKRQAQA
jgi:hypothetical protein